MAAVKSIYEPANKEKYVGTYPIISRSSWEREFMIYCDNHPDVIQWASEPVKIPYSDPVTGKQKLYVPDFLVTFKEKDKTVITKLIEIKPLNESVIYEGTTVGKGGVGATRLRNQAKWQAAVGWCGRRGIEFIILTENDIFKGRNNKYQNAKPIIPNPKASPKKITIPRSKINKPKIARTVIKSRKQTTRRKFSPRVRKARVI